MKQFIIYTVHSSVLRLRQYITRREILQLQSLERRRVSFGRIYIYELLNNFISSRYNVYVYQIKIFNNQQEITNKIHN